MGLRYSKRYVIGRVFAKCCFEPHHSINGAADVVIVNTAVEQLSCTEPSYIEPLPLLLDAIVQPACSGGRERVTMNITATQNIQPYRNLEFAHCLLRGRVLISRVQQNDAVTAGYRLQCTIETMLHYLIFLHLAEQLGWKSCAT